VSRPLSFRLVKPPELELAFAFCIPITAINTVERIAKIITLFILENTSPMQRWE
jgi:hypothetical protein